MQPTHCMFRQLGGRSTPISRTIIAPTLSRPAQSPNWYTNISTSLGNIKRRWFNSFKELFTKIQSPEDLQAYKTKIEQEGKPLSPTSAHLIHSLAQKEWLEARSSLIDKNIDPSSAWNLILQRHRAVMGHFITMEVMDKIIEQEKKFTDTGYHILYHSTHPDYYAIHYLDTQLALLQKKIEGILVPTQIPLILRQYTSQSRKEAEQIRKRLLAEGTKTTDHGPNRQYLLSCNLALTGNFDSNKPFLSSGECTLVFWGNKVNMSKAPKIDSVVSEILSEPRYKKLAPVLNKYEKRIRYAIYSLNEFLKTSILLQLVFKDPLLFEQSVYISKPYGYKRSVTVSGKEIENAQEIMKLFTSPTQKLQQEDINALQARVVLTSDLLLDVFNKRIYENFEVHAYAKPQSALDEFHKEIQQIMQDIEADYKKSVQAPPTAMEL